MMGQFRGFVSARYDRLHYYKGDDSMQCYGRTVVGASGVNADSLYVSQDNKVFAVADGASGAYDKVAAGRICTDSVQKNLYNSNMGKPADYIIKCIKEANEGLTEKSKTDGRLSFGTLTVAIIHEGLLTVGAVGDTPAFLIRGDKIIRAIKSKRRYARLIEFGVLTEEEIERIISSIPNVMWSQFDNFLPMIIPDIAIAEYEVSEDDILIICTDGISDCIENDEYVHILRSSKSLESACNTLFTLVEDRCPENNLDDRTIIIARL